MTSSLSLEDGIKLALISMDSTLRSNLSVGLPLDLTVYPKDSLELSRSWRITEGDEYFGGLRESWSTALRAAHRALPAPPYPL